MINRIIQFFKGSLRIRAYGNTVERFINNCSHSGIFLWNLTSCHPHYEMNISIKDFKKLKPVIRKTRTKIVIVNRSGFPFFIQKYTRRKLFFPGFLICMLMIFLLSTYVWNISITGNQTYTNDTIKEFLKSMEIETGMKCNDVDCLKISQELRKNFDDIIWVSTSLEGSKLIINVKENTDSQKIPSISTATHDEAYDMVASSDCQITRIVIRNGIVTVKEGDYVKKGDVIVSGQIPVLNDAKEIINYQYCTSDAEIYGKTQLTYEDVLDLRYYDKKTFDVKKLQYFLCIGNHRLTFGGIKNNYEHFTTYSEQKNFYNFTAGMRYVIPYEPMKKKYSTEEIQETLSANFTQYCNEMEKKGVVILQNDVKIYTWSDKAKAEGTLTVEMPVGQLQKSELIEIGEHIDGNDGNNN